MAYIFISPRTTKIDKQKLNVQHIFPSETKKEKS